VIAAVLVVLEILIASQAYLGFYPTVVESNRIFSLKNQRDLESGWDVNVMNSSFRLSESALSVSATRGPDDNARSVYDVYSSLNVPLEPKLRLRFSILASQVNLTTDSVRVYLTLINGTHTILLFYVVGFQPQDLIPDPMAEGYSYVFCQVGNATETQFRGERDLWTDIANRGLSVDSTWRIVKIAFGIESSGKGTGMSDFQMEGLFELNENEIYYENLTFVTVQPSNEQVSWLAVTVIITISVLFVFMSYMFIWRKTKIEKSMNSGNSMNSD
jgi:hypothetical protein